VIVAIRGTYFIVEWLIDLDAPMVEFYPQIGGNVATASQGYAEEGFYSVFTSLSFVDQNLQPFDLLQFLKNTMSGDGATTIDFVAHSLGGPIAAMLSSSIGYFDAALAAVSTVTTFAAPAPGDSGFAAYYQLYAPATYRIWNGLDVVPSALALLGYSQVPEPGIGITPTLDQLGGYDFLSVYCNHSLQTYQWLLDATWPLASGCGWFAEAATSVNMLQLQRDAVRRRQEIKRGAAKPAA